MAPAGYRQPAEPREVVQLGPLALGARHFIGAAIWFLLSVVAAGCTARAAFDPVLGSLRCTRAQQGGAIHCEEWRGRSLALVGTHVAAQAGTPRYFATHGRNAKECIAFDASSVCGGPARENTARIHALRPGESVTLEATMRDPGALFAGSLFAFIFFLGGGASIASKLRRRSVYTVRIGATSLEVVDGKGATLHVLERSPNEAVKLLRRGGGRGSLPHYEIGYQTTAWNVITQFEAGELELEPIAEKLRRALAERPRPASISHP